eukprot:5550908-Pyramimonas_sp.AAC.1
MQNAPRRRRTHLEVARKVRGQEKYGGHARTTTSARCTGSGWNIRGLGRAQEEVRFLSASMVELGGMAKMTGDAPREKERDGMIAGKMTPQMGMDLEAQCERGKRDMPKYCQRAA